MHCDPDTVELLYTALAGPQADGWEPGEPITWRIAGRPLSPSQVRRVRSATAADWDALDLLLAVDGHLLNVRREAAHDQLRAVGLPCDLPEVTASRGAA